MSNRLRLTGILTPPSDDAWQPGVGYVKFEPADERAANWGVPGYRPAWPVLGVPNALGNALMEINGGDVFVPGDEPGDTYAGPQMRVTYELRTLAGTWHRGSFLWRAVSTGGGVIDLRTPSPESEPPHVSRPGVPAGALLTTDIDNLVPGMAAFGGLNSRVATIEQRRGQADGYAALDGTGAVLARGTHGPDGGGSYYRIATIPTDADIRTPAPMQHGLVMVRVVDNGYSALIYFDETGHATLLSSNAPSGFGAAIAGVQLLGGDRPNTVTLFQAGPGEPLRVVNRYPAPRILAVAFLAAQGVFPRLG